MSDDRPTSQRRTRAIQAPPSVDAAVRQTGPKGVRAVLAFLAVVVLALSGFGYSVFGSVTNTAQDLSLGGGKGSKFGHAADGALDILLVGIDSRTDAQGNPLSPQEIEILRAGDEENENTDTLMVIRVPNDGSSATAISIPRDTYIHDNEFGNMKINGVYGAHKSDKKAELFDSGLTDETKLENQSKQAGRQALISAISDLTGITVDRYAEVGLLGFVLLTDAVGGVDVCLNEAVNDEFSGANFPAGRQRLNGPDALSFVRQRHGLPRGDLDRIVRQQAYMASLVNSVLSTNTLSNPSKLNELGDAARRSLTIDSDWDIMGLATQLSNLAGGNVQFNTIPVTSIDGVGDYGESVVTVDSDQVHEFFRDLLGPKENAEQKNDKNNKGNKEDTPADPILGLDVHVLNASTTTGMASRIGTALQKKGYQIGDIGNAPAGLYAETQVLTADADDPLVKDLARTLGNVPIVVTGSLEKGEAVVVAAADYNGPIANDQKVANSEEFQAVDDSATDGSAGSGTVAGIPGTEEEIVSPTISAGGDGPRCVN